MINRGKCKSKSCQESVCEKSMKMVTNIIKLSSFSIAQLTLGVSPVKAAKGYAPVPDETALFQLQGSRKSQEPKSRPNPMYVTKPVKHVILKKRFDDKQAYKEESVDGLADEYIRKVRLQLGFQVNKKSKLSSHANPSPQVVK